jgi:hypothetical protein
MNNPKETINTSNFINLLGQCTDNHGIIYPRNVLPEVIDQLYSCASATLESTINSINAIGELMFWSQQLEEPTSINGHTGLLLQTLSDLMAQANNAKEVAKFAQNNHIKHNDGTISINYNEVAA